MKKNDLNPNDDDLRPEYRPQDLKGGVRGKHLEQYRKGTNLALLAPDVAPPFPRMRRSTKGFAPCWVTTPMLSRESCLRLRRRRAITAHRTAVSRPIPPNNTPFPGHFSMLRVTNRPPSTPLCYRSTAEIGSRSGRRNARPRVQHAIVSEAIAPARTFHNVSNAAKRLCQPIFCEAGLAGHRIRNCRSNTPATHNRPELKVALDHCTEHTRGSHDAGMRRNTSQRPRGSQRAGHHHHRGCASQ